MDSCESLPDAPLGANGPASEALLRAGCTGFREAARYLRQLPYGRNSDRSDYRLVLLEGRGTCSTKHALLAAVAREQGLPVVLTIGIYEMNQENTPGVGPALARHGLESLPEAHCYLRHDGRRIDITRAGLAAAEPITCFHAETAIDPEQIGDYKVAFHREHLRRWLGSRPGSSLSLDALWRIRESCIEALGTNPRAGKP